MGAMSASQRRHPRRHRRADPRRLPLPRRPRGRLLRAGVGGRRRRAARPRRRGRVEGRLRAHRPRPQGPADGAVAGRRGRARASATTRRRRARPVRDEPPAARPRPGVLGQPRAGLRRARRGAGAARRGRGGGDRALRASGPTCASPATGATCACAASPSSPTRRASSSASTPTCRCRGGLGTSAAAYLAGLLAADSIFELDADVLALATELEGHPDNVAAALHGGFVACVDGEVTRLGVPIGARGGARRPATRRCAPSRRARRCPRQVPMARRGRQRRRTPRSSCSGSRAATCRCSARGLADRLHQPHRAHLYPRSAALVERRRSRWARWGRRSPAPGPTVLVWTALRGDGRRRRGAARALRGLGRRDARALRGARAPTSASCDRAGRRQSTGRRPARRAARWRG